MPNLDPDTTIYIFGCVSDKQNSGSAMQLKSAYFKKRGVTCKLV